MKGRPQARFFRTRASLRAWFVAHHATAPELWIGYYKRGVNRKSVNYLEAVEEAMCFGWVDGLLRSLDHESYANRYTPRRPGSHWTDANVKKARALIADGRMRPAGLRVFRARKGTDPDSE
ncbi:MAG TPA: hypothetical protein VFG07_09455 [Thermoplasmata archaeon]|nr:hypothetical protein [Thermoplasmata archaeon]